LTLPDAMPEGTSARQLLLACRLGWIGLNAETTGGSYSRPALERRYLQTVFTGQQDQSGGLEGVVQDGFEQAGANLLAGGEADFELIAHVHQLIDLGNDAALFCKGRNWND